MATENGNTYTVRKMFACIPTNIDLTNIKNRLLHSAAYGIKNGNHQCWQTMEWLIEFKDIDPFIINSQGQNARDILDSIDWTYAEMFNDMLERLDYWQ